MGTWVRFFVGTPRRFLATAAAIATVWGAIRPDVLERALQNVLGAIVNAVAPFLQPILTIAVMAAIAAWLFRTIFHRKK